MDLAELFEVIDPCRRLEAVEAELFEANELRRRREVVDLTGAAAFLGLASASSRAEIGCPALTVETDTAGTLSATVTRPCPGRVFVAVVPALGLKCGATGKVGLRTASTALVEAAVCLEELNEVGRG